MAQTPALTAPPLRTPFADDKSTSGISWPWIKQLSTLFSIAKAAPQIVPVPAAANSPGQPGQVAYDANFVYVCVADSTWRRSAIVAW